MSSKLLLKATGIGKTYTGTTRPFATLCHALFNSAKTGDEYPVLSGIDLEIRHGETVGIMGRNGAGKTTMLGILGGVIQPTSGTIERYGRIATLLGLTAGFNSNFTGRENAYLFCSIQGITREEANARIGDIESFAQLGRYFDLPLRTYSSGMQSRLAFSSAVHVDADLIIIDETLAVGDANFRMKCYERISQMKREGQTFLLVSHNQNMVANFCTRGIVLEGGEKIFDGPTFEAVETYKKIRTEAMGDTDFNVKSVKSSDNNVSSLENNVVLDDFHSEERCINGVAAGVIHATIKAHKDIEHLSVNFGISNQQGIVVCAWDGTKGNPGSYALRKGEQRKVEMVFEKRMLPGRYFVSAIVNELIGDVTKPLALYQNFMSFDIAGETAMSGIANLNMHINVGNV